MKQTIKTPKLIIIGLFTLCCTGFANSNFAQTKSEIPLEFKYIGKIKDQPVFQLSLHNTAPQEYFVTVMDNNRNTLYSEKVKGSNISRNYRLDLDNADLTSPDFGVRVKVTSVKLHTSAEYTIRATTSVNQQIVIAKL